MTKTNRSELYLLNYAHALDEQDPLGHIRNNYCLDRSTVNFNFNSLGMQHTNAEPYVMEFFAHWRKYGVAGHFTPIMLRNGKSIPGYASILDAFREPCRQFLGARIEEETAVFFGQSIATNILFRWLAESQQRKGRITILYEKGSFPADENAWTEVGKVINLNVVQYNASDALRLRMYEIPQHADGCIDEEELLKLMKANKTDLSMVVLGSGGVSWMTGQLVNMERIGTAAKEYGAKFFVNIAHAAGLVNLELHKWNVSAAVGCMYKNMSAGPGGPSFVFVHEDEFPHTDWLGIGGWFNAVDPIGSLQGKPLVLKQNAQRIEASNPNVLALLPLYAALEQYLSVPPEGRAEKSAGLLKYFDELFEELQNSLGDPLFMITPAKERSSEIMFKAATPKLTQDLHAFINARGIICDMRGNDRIRFGMMPLVTSYNDVRRAMEAVWAFFEKEE